MHLERYDFEKNNNTFYYSFISEGPKGKIEKVVEFSEIHPSVFNLAFGDIDKATGGVNDTVTSNNQDRDKILATVAAVVVDFIGSHPDAVVFAQGSTQARTRLYQMGIAKFWDEISVDFEIKGFVDDKWKPFKKGENYESLFLRLK